VSLRKALQHLPCDRATEATVRELLQLLRTRAGQSLTIEETARRLERPEGAVSVVLLELTDAYVLHRDGTRYWYVREPVMDLEVDRFLRRAQSRSAMTQTNVAKFRDRYGYR
jgi:predicted transcriptional regulator